MKKDIYRGRKVLITGGSSGIGLEFARALSVHECTLVLVARRFGSEEKIKEELSGKGPARLVCLKFDLGSIEGLEDLWRELTKNDLVPDILINNAGRQSYGYFYDQDLKEEMGQVTLNCVAPMYLMHKALPSMIKNNFGRVLNVGSVAGTMPGPFFSTYAATKAFLNSFSQSISAEMRGKNVKCALLLPGKTNCEAFWAIPCLREKVGGISGFASAAAVAGYGLSLIEKDTDYGVYGPRNKTTQFIKRFVPRAILNYALRKHSYCEALEKDRKVK